MNSPWLNFNFPRFDADVGYVKNALILWNEYFSVQKKNILIEILYNKKKNK